MSHAVKHVLFVCLGNACRSQMAEAFARVHGAEVLTAASAGLTPAGWLAPDTVRAMSEKGLDLSDQFSKGLPQLPPDRYDLVVNMSGFDLPGIRAVEIRSWDVPDPIFLDYDDHCVVRDAIERLVLNLVSELRQGASATSQRVNY